MATSALDCGIRVQRWCKSFVAPLASHLTWCKQVDVRIGVYGKKVGQLTLKAANDIWSEIREWSRTNNCDPRDWKKQQRKELVLKQSTPTLQRAVDDYLAASTLRTSTLRDYTNCLTNQVLPGLGPDTPLTDFAWNTIQRDGRSGRQIVIEWKKSLEKRAPVQADKALMVLRQVFGYAIDLGWMETRTLLLVPSTPSQSMRSSTIQRLPGSSCRSSLTPCRGMNRMVPSLWSVPSKSCSSRS